MPKKKPKPSEKEAVRFEFKQCEICGAGNGMYRAHSEKWECPNCAKASFKVYYKNILAVAGATLLLLGVFSLFFS